LLRDFLYARMRGVKEGHVQSHSYSVAPADELTAVLREAVCEMRAIRSALENLDSPNRRNPAMYESLRGWALAILKARPEPQPPMGDPASLRVFNAGRNYYRLRIFRWALVQFVALAGILFWTAFLIDIEQTAKAQAAERPKRPAKNEGGANASPEEKNLGKNWQTRKTFARRRRRRSSARMASPHKKPNVTTVGRQADFRGNHTASAGRRLRHDSGAEIVQFAGLPVSASIHLRGAKARL
jgi:hypothetical protein